MSLKKIASGVERGLEEGAIGGNASGQNNNEARLDQRGVENGHASGRVPDGEGGKGEDTIRSENGLGAKGNNVNNKWLL